jgi:hypothetical protein
VANGDQQPIPVDVRGLPKWLQAAVFLGVPSVIAMFLVYFLSVQTADRIDQIEKLIALQQVTMERIQTLQLTRQTEAALTKQHFDNVLVMLVKSVRQLCVAVATTPELRAKCFSESQLPEDMK